MKGLTAGPVTPTAPEAGKVIVTADLERDERDIAHALLTPEEAKDLGYKLIFAASDAAHYGSPQWRAQHIPTPTEGQVP